METRETINKMLVKFFREIMQLEEKAIITEEFSDISNNDMHIIEAVGLGKGNRMSVIAKKLNITVGSLTTSMNSLVHKGYVARQRSDKDRRVVNIYLLEKGIAAYKHHENFHRQMTDSLINSLSPEEVEIWAKTLTTLSNFFHAKSIQNEHQTRADQ